MAEEQPPPSEQPNAYAPAGPGPLLCEEFEGINTTTTRPGVGDKQLYWSDGFIPLSRRNLRTLYGIGSSLWTPASGVIAFFDFANIGSTPYMIGFLSDGSVWAVNTNTKVAAIIAPIGTIQNPSVLNIGFSQYGSQYVLISSLQNNGYFIWDGTILYQAGSLAPQVTITDNGTGYTSAPSVSASGGSGSGATFLASIANGLVTQIIITNPGSGWLAGDTVTLSISGGGGSSATATVTLMPYAVSGSSIETYSGRVWVAEGPLLQFTAPGSTSNFAASAGGGSVTSSDSFLRVQYTSLIQTNGFLYLIADSSINYISGVNTSGSFITTFTNQNADPETGTVWPGTVDVFGRNIVFANAFGAHVSYGAAVTKISEALDGVYNTSNNFAGLIPSAAKAIIFGKKVWMLLLPIIDPVSGQQVNKLFMWNGKIWWSSPQDIPLRYIQHQEINSVLTAYGTDGLSVYPLFNQPSIAFTKTVQSRLWDAPGGYQFGKSTNRFWMLTQYYSSLSPNLTVSIDNEEGESTQAVSVGPPVMNWTTTGGETMNWTTAGGQPMVWTATGISVSEPQAVAQNGTLLGITVETQAADMAIISMTMQPEITAYRG